MISSDGRSLPGIMETCLFEGRLAVIRGDLETLDWARTTWKIFARIHRLEGLEFERELQREQCRHGGGNDIPGACRGGGYESFV